MGTKINFFKFIGSTVFTSLFSISQSFIETLWYHVVAKYSFREALIYKGGGKFSPLNLRVQQSRFNPSKTASSSTWKWSANFSNLKNSRGCLSSIFRKICSQIKILIRCEDFCKEFWFIFYNKLKCICKIFIFSKIS